MAKIKCRTAYNAREESFPGVVFLKPSMTQQHFRDESNINVIVDRYTKTGIIDNVAATPPLFADVSSIPTNLQAAYEAVDSAEVAFGSLPSDIRKSLNNDPRMLESWLLNPDNLDQAVAAGLLVRPENTSVQQNISETAPDSADNAG